MQLSSFRVTELFGVHSHAVHFPTSVDDAGDVEAGLVILHGRNGVGKTTVLKMIDGIMRLDFDAFRAVPFATAELAFNDGQVLRVRSLEQSLSVSFAGNEVRLAIEHSGPRNDSEAADVNRFRKAFFQATSSISFEYLTDARTAVEADRVSGRDADIERYLAYRDNKAKKAQQKSLASKVQDFIRDAQIDSGSFFRSPEPDLFDRIIEDLNAQATTETDRATIVSQLSEVIALEKVQSSFDLFTDRWDFDKLVQYMSANSDRTMTVVGTYAEFLLSRAKGRNSLVERLLTFERVMREFLVGKEVRVSAKTGMNIISRGGQSLSEDQLSSGEYQLLYLMVAALTTKRRGTVIAIDEPELSMHIEWQRKLVRSLMECASRAAPQFILATHSPDIAAGYRQNMVHMDGFQNAPNS